MKRRWLVILFIITISLGITVYALNESDNNEAVAYLENRSIVNGDGVSFRGNDYITVYEISAMLCRSVGFTYDAKWAVAKNQYVTYALANNWLYQGQADDPAQYLIHDDVDNILCRFYDIPVNDVPHDGLFATRYEVAQWLYEILTYVENNDIVPVYYDDTESRKYAQSWIFGIPYQIRQEFVNDGWTLYLGDRYFRDWFYDIYGEATGLTRQVDKMIVVSGRGQYSSISHEFGHFLHIVNGYDPEFVRIYEAELEQSGYSVHHVSTWREYYAQSFSYYINGMDDCMLNIPRTYKYFERLEENGWIIK